MDSNSNVSDLVTRSQTKPVLIFKHSTRCSISSFALRQLIEGNDALTATMEVHYLDLLQYRSISNAIANELDVVHQSPQVILLDKGKVLGSLSHEQVNPESILSLHKK